MRKYLYISLILLSLFILSCRGSKSLVSVNQPYTGYEQHLIDSILQYGLDHEALYTMLGDIKPMSSLVSFWLPIANNDSLKKISANVVNRETHGIYLDKLYSAQQALNKLDFPDLRFVLIPYKASQGNKRIVQLSVVRVSSLDSLLKVKESFFGQFGLVPGADPAVVVSMIENADRYERNRGYGYLFGYPDYAVDFFVNSAISANKNKSEKPEPRSFFQIPVYAGNNGYFVYAYPKDREPTAVVDSVIYHKSEKVLHDYKKIRNNYVNADSTIRAYQLLRTYYK